MKNYYLFLLTLFPAACHHPVKEVKAYDYCYSNDRGVFLFSIADKQETRLNLEGNDVRLSPNGARVAYTYVGAPDHERRVAMMDLGDKKTTILDSGCRNCYGPVWSPDGNYLVYNAFTGSNWSIKCVDKDNRQPVMIAEATNAQHGYYAPAWTADGKKIILQDMSAIYLYDVNGALVKTISMQDIDTALYINSSSQFLLTAGEGKLVFEKEVMGDSTAEEPPLAIFAYDLHSKKLNRISPAGYDCFHPLLKGDTVFFSGIKGIGRHSHRPIINIYSADLNGGHFGLVFKDRSEISCRLPGQ